MKIATPNNLRPCTMHPTTTTNPNQLSTATWKPANASFKSTASKNTWPGPLRSPPSTSLQCLRDKWMEFQGIRNWEGLLDPLHDQLRNEILRYGEFVEAAYRSFDSDTSSPTYGSCPHPAASMLSRSGTRHINKCYKVTRYLHATCGVHLPDRWRDRIPSWVSCRSSWIGYVAVCTDDQEIARLGRRDVVVAYRGTVTCMEWVENLRATLTCLLDDMSPAGNPSTPMVQSGLLSMYTSSSDNRPSLQDAIREEIGKVIREYVDEPLSITVTGHSLGAALATLTAHDITRTFDERPLVTVVSFGGPRVGNKSFRRQLERSGAKVLRIVNSDDPVTKVPGFVLDEKATVKPRKASWASEWVRRRVEGTQWVYAEVGNELRLSSCRECPLLKTGGVATCHDLRTYLRLVDNFVSSELSCKCHGSE